MIARSLFLVCGLVSSGAIAAQSADEIMARVAQNQDRAMQLRADYVYRQHIVVETRRPNGKLMRREVADYDVAPTPSGIEKKLSKIEGRYFKKGKYLEFQGEPIPEKDSMDGDFVFDFRDDLLNEKTKDGLAHDLFPFTSDEQKKYRFKLLGEETVQGRKAYRIGFGPIDKSDLTWAGEEVIDEEEYQPVTVFTRLSRRIPFAIRTLLGTDLPGIGFNVRYQRFDKDIWFPVSFGTEFRMHLVFFINRQVSISSESTGFRRANVNSTIQFTSPQ